VLFQADLKRHLEAVIVKVQSLVYEFCSALLSANGSVSASTVFKVLHEWTKFKKDADQSE
jgi:hypothetical protein